MHYKDYGKFDHHRKYPSKITVFAWLFLVIAVVVSLGIGAVELLVWLFSQFL